MRERETDRQTEKMMIPHARALPLWSFRSRFWFV
jgi:hypothetical protein